MVGRSSRGNELTITAIRLHNCFITWCGWVCHAWRNSIAKTISSAGHGDSILAVLALHTYTSAAIPTPCSESRTNLSWCNVFLQNGLYYANRERNVSTTSIIRFWGCVCVYASKSYSSFITIVGTSTTADPSTSVSMTPPWGGIRTSKRKKNETDTMATQT